MTHQYKKLSVTMKMWMQFNVMLWTRKKKDKGSATLQGREKEEGDGGHCTANFAITIEI